MKIFHNDYVNIFGATCSDFMIRDWERSTGFVLTLFVVTLMKNVKSKNKLKLIP